VSNLRSKNINRKKLTAIKSVVLSESIINRILVIRDQKVILDKDLAKLYGVETRALKQAVKRNLKRFPLDFMFILNGKEINSLVSQNVIPSKSYLGGAKPYVFTEQGVAMLSSVLNSERAIEINILIMRAFVKLREIISTHKKVEQKLKEIENKLQDHEEQIVQIIEVINELLAPPPAEKKKIGFTIDD
jgi:phage regulator Rha-like protein